MAKPPMLTTGRSGRAAAGVVTPPPPGPPVGAANAGAAIAAEAAFRGSAAPDTLIPGATPRRPDNLLPRPALPAAPVPRAPRAARPRNSPAGARPGLPAFAREYWRHGVVLVVVGVALTMSVMAVWPVLFDRTSSPHTPGVSAQARAETLLRSVVRGGHTVFEAHHSFKGVSAATLSAHASGIPVVGNTNVTTLGRVSMSVTSPSELTLATPVDTHRCEYARSQPSKSLTQFVTVANAQCRAGAAPARGWHS